MLRQSLEEGCDGYPKGGSEEVQSTCRYPVFAKFILLDLLRADTHQGSQCFETESCLKPPLSKAVADSDVYRMNFVRLVALFIGGSSFAVPSRQLSAIAGQNPVLAAWSRAGVYFRV